MCYMNLIGLSLCCSFWEVVMKVELPQMHSMYVNIVSVVNSMEPVLQDRKSDVDVELVE